VGLGGQRRSRARRWARLVALQQRRRLLDDADTTGPECTFAVHDVDRTRARIVEAGGRILMERLTIAGVGHLLGFEDPAGNAILGHGVPRRRPMSETPGGPLSDSEPGGGRQPHILADPGCDPAGPPRAASTGLPRLRVPDRD
jgi:hypothetical protein